MTKDKARDLAVNILYQVFEEGAYANLVLDKALFQCADLDKRDKGFVTELVYGTVKNRGRIDWTIDQFAKPKIAKQDPWIRNILRLAVYQLLYLDKVPDSAAINEAVELAKEYGNRGAEKFVNGVLRNLLRGMGELKLPSKGKYPVQYLSVYYSYPQWLVEAWVKYYGKKNAELLCEYFNRPAPLWIRTNTLKMTRDQLQEKLAQQNILTTKSRYTLEGLRIDSSISLHQLELFQKGAFIVQDESSILLGDISGAKPGMRVLDVCSAPGGKTTHLAQQMQNKGEIIACDIHPHRLQLIEENAKRLGIDIIKTCQQDARYLTERFGEEFDLVLVDAPCSGLGVLGRRADSRWKKHKSDIEELAALQKEILHQAAKVVKPNGRLIYSTCTIMPQENQMQIADFLAEHTQYRLADDMGQHWPIANKGHDQAMVQLLSFEDQTDGFFIACMERSKYGS